MISSIHVSGVSHISQLIDFDDLFKLSRARPAIACGILEQFQIFFASLATVWMISTLILNQLWRIAVTPSCCPTISSMRNPRPKRFPHAFALPLLSLFGDLLFSSSPVLAPRGHSIGCNSNLVTSTCCRPSHQQHKLVYRYQPR